MKLLVRNLARSTAEQYIHKLFSAHGTVTECTLVLDQETGLSKGFHLLKCQTKKKRQTQLLHLINLLLIAAKSALK